MKKIFIAGCGGMLGDAFYNVFKEEFEILCLDINISEKWLEFLDKVCPKYLCGIYNISPENEAATFL